MATLKRLRDMIRFEAGVKGADTLISVIDAVINDTLTHLTSLMQCPELKMVQIPIPVSGAGTSDVSFPLPQDLQHFLKDRVFYAHDSTVPFEEAQMIYQSNLQDGRNSGRARTFQREGLNLILYPDGDVTDTAQLFIDYYRVHTPLVNDNDVFPIPVLELPVKMEAIARVSRHGASALSAAYQVDAARTFSGARGVAGRG